MISSIFGAKCLIIWLSEIQFLPPITSQNKEKKFLMCYITAQILLKGSGSKICMAKVEGTDREEIIHDGQGWDNQKCLIICLSEIQFFPLKLVLVSQKFNNAVCCLTSIVVIKIGYI